jgi:hypothetical protein
MFVSLKKRSKALGNLGIGSGSDRIIPAWWACKQHEMADVEGKYGMSLYRRQVIFYLTLNSYSDALLRQ